jgi:hypothetical protein
MSYIEITARLKLRELGKRSPEDDFRLSNALREEIEALLDRLHKSGGIGESPHFDIDPSPFVKVSIVK